MENCKSLSVTPTWRVFAHHAHAVMQSELKELQHMRTHTNTHTQTHTPKHTASVMLRDLITDLRVIDVGGARATYKIQNKGSVLSAYRKNITQDQTPKAQQQKQNRGMEKNEDGKHETRAKAPHQSTSKEEPF